ncbi:MAG: pyridoxal phosphate-dependent aminotransferase [Bacteroidota bacterium]
MDDRDDTAGAGGGPRFSRRIDWRRAENALARAESARRRAGLPILDLTESNPTAAGLLDDASAQAIADALARAPVGRYAPTPRGLPAARRAVADAYARTGVAIDPERLILTASSSESYSHLWKVLCDPGDAVIVPEPSYPLFDYLARLDCVSTTPYRLIHDFTRNGRWDIDLASVDGALAGGPERPAALVVVSPNNPTGSVLREDDLAALDQRAAATGTAIVCDEVFADYVVSATAGDNRSAAGVRCAAARSTEALTFSLGGLSKSCGLPHLKLGWIVVGGPRRLVQAALDRLDLVADTYLSVGTPVQEALPDLLRVGAGVRQAITTRVADNRRALHAAIGRDSPLTLLHSEGGWSAIVRVPAVRDDEQWALALLEKDNVLCHPGYFFDMRGGVFLVLSLLPAPDTFAEAVRRLIARVADSVP